MKKIMFNDAYGLTRATIEGRKTMTRRLISPKLGTPMEDESFDAEGFKALCCEFAQYKLGEVVAVAQRYADIEELAMLKRNPFHESYFEEEDIADEPGWSNKMFVKAGLMPHRIRITGIRAELLQDISDEDCIKEGVRVVLPDFAIQPTLYEVAGLMWATPRQAFAALIDKVSGHGTWARNPWVVAYEYELVK